MKPASLPINLFAWIRLSGFMVLAFFLSRPAFGYEWEVSTFSDSRKARAIQLITSSYSPRIKAKKLSNHDSSSCRIDRYQINGLDPVDKKDRAVRVLSYGAQGSAKLNKAVIIVPSIMGTTMLESGYADSFCRSNIRAVVIESIDRDYPVDISIASYDRAALRKLAAIRHVVEFLYSNRSTRIGILGTSQGALAASLALGVERKIKAGALIAGGGDLAEIVVDSTEESQAALREQRFKEFGYRNRTEYLKALREGIVINNLDFAGYTGFKPVWMSIVTGDTVVPTRTQLALAKALKPKQVVQYNGDHVGGILKTYLVSSPAVVQFFKSAL